jgi:hypothetical protein
MLIGCSSDTAWMADVVRARRRLESEWSRKGATLSDKTVQKEFGLTRDEIARCLGCHVHPRGHAAAVVMVKASKHWNSDDTRRICRRAVAVQRTMCGRAHRPILRELPWWPPRWPCTHRLDDQASAPLSGAPFKRTRQPLLNPLASGSSPE